MAPGCGEVCHHAGGEQSRRELRHLHDGLSMEQTLYGFSPLCAMDDEKYPPSQEIRHLGRRSHGIWEAKAREQMVVGSGRGGRDLAGT